MADQKTHYIIKPLVVAVLLFTVNLVTTTCTIILNFNAFGGLGIQFFLGCFQLLLAFIFLFIIPKQDNTYRLLINYWKFVGAWLLIAIISFWLEAIVHGIFEAVIIVLPMFIACYHLYFTYQLIKYFKK